MSYIHQRPTNFCVIVKANLQANPDGLYRSGYVDLVYNGNKEESIRIAQSN